MIVTEDDRAQLWRFARNLALLALVVVWFLLGTNNDAIAYTAMVVWGYDIARRVHP
jgi:hypothetical protein